MKKWIALTSVLFFCACDETNVTSTAETMNLVAERDSSEPLDSLDGAAIESIDTVRSIYSLGSCTRERAGTITFVIRNNAYYICEDADWHQTELPEELMVETSSSLEESSSSENELEESSSSFEELSSSEMQSSSSQEESSSSVTPSSSSSQKGSSSSVTPSSSSSQKVSSSSATPSSSSQKVSSSSATSSSSSQKVSSSSATPSSSSQKVSSSSATPSSSSSQKVSSTSTTPSSSSQTPSSSSAPPSSSSQTPSSSSAPPSSSSQVPSSSSAPPSSSSQVPSSSSAPPSSSSQVPSSSSAPQSSSSVESSSSVVAADKYDCSIYDCVTTAYLNQEMLAAGLYDEFLDTRDNKVYRTVKIGTQTWFAQSLAYNVGTASCSENDSSCVAGKMYTWTQVMDISDSYTDLNASSVISSTHQGICPSGYHVPTNAEFQTLYDYVVSSISATSVTTELNSSYGWATVTGTDSFGFSMLPGNATMAGDGRAAFWTASQVSAVRAYRWFKDYSRNSYSGYNFSNTISDEKFRTMQLRCLRN